MCFCWQDVVCGFSANPRIVCWLGEQRIWSHGRSKVTQRSCPRHRAEARCSWQASDILTSKGLQRNAGGIGTGIMISWSHRRTLRPKLILCGKSPLKWYMRLTMFAGMVNQIPFTVVHRVNCLRLQISCALSWSKPSYICS